MMDISNVIDLMQEYKLKKELLCILSLKRHELKYREKLYKDLKKDVLELQEKIKTIYYGEE